MKTHLFLAVGWTRSLKYSCFRA